MTDPRTGRIYVEDNNGNKTRIYISAYFDRTPLIIRIGAKYPKFAWCESNKEYSVTDNISLIKTSRNHFGQDEIVENREFTWLKMEYILALEQIM